MTNSKPKSGSYKSKIIAILVALIVMIGIPSNVHAVAASLTFNPVATTSSAAFFSGTAGVNGVNTVLYDGQTIATVWDINTACAADIVSIKASADYFADYTTTDAQGAFLFVGDTATFNPLGSITGITEGVDLGTHIFSDIGGSHSKDGTVSGVWSNDLTLSTINVATILFGQNTYIDGVTTINKPVVDIEYSEGSVCRSIVTPTNPAMPTAESAVLTSFDITAQKNDTPMLAQTGEPSLLWLLISLNMLGLSIVIMRRLTCSATH